MKTVHQTKRKPARRARALKLETLERRALLSIDLVPTTGWTVELWLTGSSTSDHAEVRTDAFPGGLTRIRAQLNSETFDFYTGTYGPWITSIRFDGNAGADFFQNNTSIPCTAYGGNGADTLIGGGGGDYLDGDTASVVPVIGFSDRIEGRGGNDTILGGVGGDNLFGGDGHDSMDGGAGNDVIYGGDGNDTILCGPGTLHYVFCGEGDDTVQGSSGVDYVWGAFGNDEIRGEAGDDHLRGNPGEDVIRGGPGRDDMHGDEDDDELYGDNDADSIWGGLGDDTVEGGPGQDTLYGDQETGDSHLDGNDTIRGGNDLDRLFGQQGHDTIEGNFGPDEIDAGPGDDHVWGGYGNDTIVAGSGNDQVWGEHGWDSIDCGYGDDTVDGGSGNDTITGGDGVDVLHGGDENDRISGDGHADYLYGDDGNDELYGDGFEAHWRGYEDFLWGNDGNDRLVGGLGDDHLMGGPGMDALFSLLGNDLEVAPDDAGAVNESDRLYTRSSSRAQSWDNGVDAAFLVQDTRMAWWTQPELDIVDDGIRLIHEANGSDCLIQRSNGQYVTLIRERDAWWNGDVDGWNDGSAVHLCNSTFDSGAAIVTTVHEFGHFWDTESPVWDEFRRLSQWTMVSHAGQAGWRYEYAYGEEWWWRDPADFYRAYGHTHPVEDWCTCWEAYFFGAPGSRTPDTTHAWMQANMFAKWEVIDAFIRTYRR